MTASEFINHSKVEIAADANIQVKEHFTIIPGFSYGIGLDMVIHEELLTPQNIDEAIKKFILLGEKNWQGEQSYTFPYKKTLNQTVNAIAFDV